MTLNNKENTWGKGEEGVFLNQQTCKLCEAQVDNAKEQLEQQRKKAEAETEEALKKLGCDILVTSKKCEQGNVKLELTGAQRKFMPKVTPNGDKLNMFNHSTYFNMSLIDSSWLSMSENLDSQFLVNVFAELSRFELFCE